MTRDDRFVSDLAKDFRSADLSDPDRAMLEYAARLTLEPWRMEERDVISLRRHGFTDAAILDINQITGYYAFVNRLADGLGVALEPFWNEEGSRS